MLGINRRPALARPAKSPYEAVLRVSSQGMLFSFSERNYLEGREPATHGRSRALIFTNVAITAGIPDVMCRYAGSALPFGLDWEDNRSQAREKLAAAGWGIRLRAYKRDAWWLPDHRVRLTYQPGDIGRPERSGIFDISLGVPMPASAKPSFLREYPTCDQIIGLFGVSPASPRFQALFRDFDPVAICAQATMEVVDRDRTFGFSLCFDKARPAQDGQPSFAGVVMCRDRLGASTAWNGELPFGLNFDDSPSVYAQHFGRKANRWVDQNICGSARWDFSGYSVRIDFDNLDNCVETISVLRSGYHG